MILGVFETHIAVADLERACRMLPDEPRPEVNVVSWDAWQRLHGRRAAGDSPPNETSVVSAQPALAPCDRGRR